MVRKSAKNNHLEEAVTQLVWAQANLVQSQAQLTQQQTVFLARLSETDKELATLRKQTDERFARIETLLSQLVRLVQELPEAVKDKIGFKPAEQQNYLSTIDRGRSFPARLEANASYGVVIITQIRRRDAGHADEFSFSAPFASLRCKRARSVQAFFLC